MKYLPLGLAALFAPLLSSGALAAACSLTGYTVSPNLMAYSLPGLGLKAFEDGVPVGCVLSMPIQTGGADVVSLFSASYSGELTPLGSGGQLTVTHNGVTEVTDVPVDTFGELATGTVFAHGDQLSSTFSIQVTHPFGGDELDLDTADYLLLSKTNLFDLSTARTAVVTQLNGTTDLLDGSGQSADGADGVSVLGGVGSVTLGLTGRKQLDAGFSVRGGAAYIDQSTPGATASGIVLSGAARYVPAAEGQPYQPFVEAGLTAAPSLSMTLGLTFTTPTTTTIATGTSSANYYGGYLKGGVQLTPSAQDKVVVAATAAADWLSTGVISETPGGAGTFTVDQPAQTGLFNSLKVGADWTRQFSPAVSGTLSAAVGRTLALSDVSSTIAGAGTFATAGASENFAEYGARATYAVTEATSLSAFVFGTSGELSGTHVQVGGIAHISF